MDDLISRRAATSIPILPKEHRKIFKSIDDAFETGWNEALSCVNMLPSAQSERDIPKRVLWSGWKGTRDTRYRCPNCKKPVRNTDVHCHRCGQKLMFPHISFTKYVPGEKQQTIVRWDDDNNGID